MTLNTSKVIAILEELFDSGANQEEIIDYFDNLDGHHHHRDSHDDHDHDHDNGYSYAEQCSADRLDWANESSCPIQRAERRAGA
jgi:hypothetical protein